MNFTLLNANHDSSISIGTLYCAKGNYEFGISRVIKSLEPYNKKLGTDTWFYAKRCFLSLIENLAKHMISVRDSVMQVRGSHTSCLCTCLYNHLNTLCGVEVQMRKNLIRKYIAIVFSVGTCLFFYLRSACNSWSTARFTVAT
jgi:hypothetical protein